MNGDTLYQLTLDVVSKMPMKLRDGKVCNSNSKRTEEEQSTTMSRSFSRRSRTSKSVVRIDTNTNTHEADNKRIDYTSTPGCVSTLNETHNTALSSHQHIERISTDTEKQDLYRTPLIHSTEANHLPISSIRHISRSINTSTPVRLKEYQSSCEINRDQTDNDGLNRSTEKRTYNHSSHSTYGTSSFKYTSILDYSSRQRRAAKTNLNLSDEAFFDLSKPSVSDALQYNGEFSTPSYTSSLSNHDDDSDILHYMDHEKWSYYHDNRRYWYLNRWKRSKRIVTTHRHVVIRIIHHIIIYILSSLTLISKRTRKQRHSILSTIAYFWTTTVRKCYTFISNVVWLTSFQDQKLLTRVEEEEKEEKSKRRRCCFCCGGCCCILFYFLLWFIICFFFLVLLGKKFQNTPVSAVQPLSTDFLMLIQSNWNGKSKMQFLNVNDDEKLKFLHLPPLHSKLHKDASMWVHDGAPALILYTDLESVDKKMTSTIYELMDIIKNVSSLGYHVIVTPNRITSKPLCTIWSWLHEKTQFSFLYLWAHGIAISKVEFASKQLCQNVVPPSGVLITTQIKDSISNEVSDIETWSCQCTTNKQYQKASGDSSSDYLNVRCPVNADSLYSDLVNCLTSLNQ